MNYTNFFHLGTSKHTGLITPLWWKIAVNDRQQMLKTFCKINTWGYDSNFIVIQSTITWNLLSIIWLSFYDLYPNLQLNVRTVRIFCFSTRWVKWQWTPTGRLKDWNKIGPHSGWNGICLAKTCQQEELAGFCLWKLYRELYVCGKWLIQNYLMIQI